MKIVFIQHNGQQESIGITCLSAYLKVRGHTCDLFLEANEKDLYGVIRRERPDLVGLSAITGLHNETVRLARNVKEYFNVPVIVGGPHPTFFPEMIEIEGIDIICRGEGEEALVELMNALEGGSDVTRIRNLWIKHNGVIHRNELRPLISDLDQLPIPDRELYYKYSFLRDLSMKRFMTGYGCPYPCSFCHEPLLRKEYALHGGKFTRKKGVRRVLDEINAVRNKYVLKHIHFSDDMFHLNDDWLEEFAKLYKKEVGLPFTCNMRFDSLTERTVALLKEACCQGVAVGLETGSEYLRNVVLKKNCTNEMIEKGSSIVRKYGIKLLTSNMIGLPGETLEQAFETVALNAKIRVNYSRALSFMAFPKVELVEYAKKNGYLGEDYGVDAYRPEPQEIALRTKYENEFKNICSLFYVMVKTPRLMPIYKKIVRLPDNVIFRLIGAMNILQEIIFFELDIVCGLKFFKNTVMTKHNRLKIQWLPKVFREKRVYP